MQPLQRLVDRFPVAFDHLGAAPSVFESVEEATRALAHAARYARHRSAAPDPPAPTPAAEDDHVAALIAEGLAAGGGWMSTTAAAALLRSVGLPVIESRSAATPHNVRRAAEELGGRVAVKATGTDLLHKSDLGAVRLGLTAAGAERAAREMQASLKAAVWPLNDSSCRGWRPLAPS